MVVEQLIELGYLDDEAFARAWVESRDRARPRGESALRQELVLKSVSRDVIDAVLDARRNQVAGSEETPGGGTPQPSPDVSAARRLLERKRASLDREPDVRKRRQRAYALLARNGFGSDVIREAISSSTPVAVDPDD